MEQNTFSNSRIQVIAIIVSVTVLVIIFNLIRKKKIKEEYSLLWILFGIVFVVLSIWRNGLEYIADLLGINYAPAALFIILLAAVFFILIEFSIIISNLTTANKNLAQEIGILKAEIRRLKEKHKNDSD
jgi:hypothetical protein